MTDGRLNADVDGYRQAAAMNTEPPAITSDPLIGGAVPVEQLLQILGLAANAGDAGDSAESLDGYAERDARTTEAAAGFESQDQGAALQVAQQLPQLLSGLAGAVSGALTGALAPLSQLPQQLTASVSQSLPQQDSGMELIDGEDPGTEPLSDPDPNWLGDTATGEGGTGAVGSPALDTAPTAVLGPAPVPVAGTYPSAAPPPSTPAPAGAAITSPHPAAMAGMPMVPPALLPGSATGQQTKSETKRLAVGSVRNGAPVAGRIAAAPVAPVVTKLVDGKPVTARQTAQPPT